MKLTKEESKAIDILNYIVSLDVILSETNTTHEDLLERGIKKFIPKAKRHLVEINSEDNPPRIDIYSW